MSDKFFFGKNIIPLIVKRNPSHLKCFVFITVICNILNLDGLKYQRESNSTSHIEINAFEMFLFVTIYCMYSFKARQLPCVASRQLIGKIS